MHAINVVATLSIAIWAFISFTQAQVATVSLAPASAATLTARSEPTLVPAGSITGIPDDGLDLILSDSVYAGVKSALSNSCSTPNSATCQSALQAALSQANLQANQLQPRQAGLIIAGIVGLVSIFLGSKYNANNLPPKIIHITPQELGAASSIATATAVAAIPPGGGAATTFPVLPRPTTTATPTVSIAPQASGGDLHILMTSSQATAVQNILNLPGVCAGSSSSKRKRQSGGSGVNCIYQGATAILYNLFQGQSFPLSYVLTPSSLPGFSDPSIQQGFTQFTSDAGVAAPALGVTTSRMIQIAATAWYLSYIYNYYDTSLGTDNVISGSLLSTTTKNTCPSTQQSGASTNLICSASYCLADPQIKICTTTQWLGCRCVTYTPPMLWENYDTQMMQFQPDALTQWLAGAQPAASNPTTCFSASQPNVPAYITANTAYNQVNSFCQGIKDSSPLNVNSTFYSGTPDYFAFVITGSYSGSFDVNGCKSALNSILTNCDGVPSNPMNWKWGGTFQSSSSSLKYMVQPLFSNRVWPAPTSPNQQCTGTYHGLYDSFSILGSGWSSWDYGQKTLYPSITACVGSMPSGWKFKYFLYDGTPDSHFGAEWLATFNTPIWTRARCFDNNKVQGNSGGPGKGGGGCGGDG